jgi:hypothetical protein
MFKPRLNFNSALSAETSTAMAICESVNTPFSLSLWIVLKHEQWDEVLKRVCNPLDYDDTRSFRDDYLISSLLKKSPNIPLGIDRKQVAIDSFWESEKTCASFNKKLASNEFIFGLYETKKELHKILGSLTGNELSYVESRFRFGPGAQAFQRGTGSTAADKFAKNIVLTTGLIPFYRTILGEEWWKHQTSPEVVRGNEFTVVPKNAKTDRGICKEPTLNSFVQLGIGSLIRSKLMRNGIDLNDQTRNQRFAKRAYDEGFATIDLSKASDSVSKGLVEYLLPARWFHLVNCCRSASTHIEGQWHSLEKFSSMGNGYTFELESVLFLALARSVVPKDEWRNICVYGDDLIVPKSYASDLVDTLNSLGFEVNTEKSYLAGNFFESCGADFFKGQPVRPFYLRKDALNDNGIPQGLQIANALRLYSRRIMHDSFCDKRFLPVWVSLVKKVPRAWRNCRGPVDFGDTVLLSSSDEAPHVLPKHGHEGRIVRHISLSVRKRLVTNYGIGFVLLQSAGNSENPTYGKLPISRLFGSPKTSRSLVKSWDHGLCWE